jgi:hypothetical protein
VTTVLVINDDDIDRKAVRRVLKGERIRAADAAMYRAKAVAPDRDTGPDGAP